MACCLCKDSLPANHRKRKRVQSCPAAVFQLEKLCSEVGRSLSEIVFGNKQLIWFCSSCERDLNRITTLESNLATLKTRIANKVCAGTGNTNVQGASVSTTSTPRLVPLLQPAVSAGMPSKRQHLDRAEEGSSEPANTSPAVKVCAVLIC